MRKHWLLIFVGLLLLVGISSASYTSQYPPAHSSTYVKATSEQSPYEVYHVTDPATSLTGSADNNAWVTNWATNQSRVHIDLGGSNIIKRIYYENFAISGGYTNVGAKDFTVWGSNTAGSFSTLTYGTDTGWTQITPSQSTFDQHTASDVADPKYITLTNTNAYRYYALKISSTWGNANLLGMRRVELQTEDGGEEPSGDPYADFIAESISGAEPLNVSFIDLSFGSPTSWIWNRTDVTGNNTQLTFSTDQSPENVTFIHGNWSIQLTATNEYGSNTTLPNTVFVNLTTMPPVAAFSANATYGSGHIPVQFTDESIWSGGGERIQNGSFETGTFTGSGWTGVSGASVAASEPHSGVYSAYLENGRPGGYEQQSYIYQTVDLTGVSQISYWVKGDSTSIFVDSDYIGGAYLPSGYTQYIFNVSYEGYHTIRIVGAYGGTVTYVDDVGAISGGAGEPTDWDWYWYANETKSSDLQNPETTLTAGIYNVRLYASNSGGGDWENKTSYITVAPRATNFISNVTGGYSPLVVAFNDTSEGTPNNWDWYWYSNETKSSDLENPITTLTTGLYNIRLYTSTVSGEGSWENKTGYINVTAIPPISSFSANVTSGMTPLVVAFTDSTDNTPTNWDWYWYANETKASDSQNPTKVFTAGTYNIRLYTSNTGGGDWENKTAYITATARSSAFSANATSGADSLAVLFTDASNGTPNNWDWYWSNDEIKDSDLQNPTTTFTPGTYNVRLYTTNAYGEGDWENKTAYISVTGTATVSAFSANVTSGVTPLSVRFTDSSTNTPTNWDWYWSDDEIKDSDSQNPTKVFTTGVYNIRLYTSNAYGGDWENKTAYIEVTTDVVAPTAAFSADVTSGITPLSVAFTDYSTNTPTNWDWYWSDDEIKDSDSQNPSDVFAAGLYNVRLYVSNEAGGDWENKTAYINVSSPSLPVAEFSGTPLSGVNPLLVSFTDLSVNPTSWYWSFGDTATSTLENPSHTYTSSGGFTVSLTVTNPSGSDTETKNLYVVVHEPAGPGGTTGFFMEVSNASTGGFIPIDERHTVYRGDTVRFVDNSSGAPSSWDWKFGDGYAGTTQNPEHTYSFGKYPIIMRNGYKDLEVSLSTPEGGTYTDTIRFTSPLPPIVTQSTNITLMDESLSENFTEALTGNRTAPPGWSGFDWLKGIVTTEETYGSVLGTAVFLILIFSLPFLMNWIATKDFIVAGVIGGFLGVFIIVRLPAQLQLLALGFIVMSLVAVIYSLLKERP